MSLGVKMKALPVWLGMTWPLLALTVQTCVVCGSSVGLEPGSFGLPARKMVVISGLLAGAPDWLGDRLGAIGHRLGLVFQMRDDLLGVFGSAAETGKSCSNDLREGKQTLLVAYAHGTAEWSAASHLFGREDLDEAGADVLRGALEASGARSRLEQEVHDERDAALTLIGGADLPDALARLLAGEAERAAERRS